MSVQSAINKLEEMLEIELCQGACRHHSHFISFGELREILVELGDNQDHQLQNRYEYLVSQIKMCNKRIEAIENKCGCKVKWKEDTERRIAELESHKHDNANKPSAKVEQISISREVAEEVLLSGFELPNELYDELKKALGQ